MSEVQKMRLLVFGGRDYQGYDILFRQLDILKPKVIMHGDASGADTGADVWAVVNGYVLGETLLRYPAEWRRDQIYRKEAGVERNAFMLKDGKPTHGLMFPGGTGTEDMHKRLVAAKIPIRRGD